MRMWQVGGALDIICNTHVCLNVSFPTTATLKLYTKHQIVVPSQYGKLLTVLKGDISIAYEVFQNLSQMHSADGRCFWQHFAVIYRSHQFHINQH